MQLAPVAIQFGVAAGGSMGAAFVAVRWFANFVAGRLDKREAHIDGATQRLIEGLESRVEVLSTRLDRVETELRECEKKHAESEAEVMRLKATMQGYGDARDRAAMIVASEKREAKG